MLSLFSSISLVLTVSFLTYVAFIVVPFIRQRSEVAGDPDRFSWHIFVPCRDEEAVIATTIRRQRERFPHAHLWVVDDDSDDETASIVLDHAATDDHVHLVRRFRPDARTGKGDVLNSAYAALNDWITPGADQERVIVCVVDADGEMASTALTAVASDSCFGNPRVGAAQITVWMKNRDDPRPYPHKGRAANALARYLIRMQDIEFRTIIPAMQSLRTRTGTVGLGGNGQFTRLSVLDAIAEQFGRPWHGALLEDYELGLHVLFAGYENRHVHSTYVAQEALPSLRRLIVQRSRWSQGNIQCVKYLAEIIRSPHFDSGGVLESIYYLFLPFIQLLGVVVFGALWGLLVTSFVTTPASFTVDWTFLGLSIALWFVFGLSPFFIWAVLYKLRCEPDSSWPVTLARGFGLWVFVLYIFVSTARAFWRVVRGKNGWAKTRRNAELHVVGPTAKDH